jgi:hypothetical protein
LSWNLRDLESSKNEPVWIGWEEPFWQTRGAASASVWPQNIAAGILLRMMIGHWFQAGISIQPWNMSSCGSIAINGSIMKLRGRSKPNVNGSELQAFQFTPNIQGTNAIVQQFLRVCLNNFREQICGFPWHGTLKALDTVTKMHMPNQSTKCFFISVNYWFMYIFNERERYIYTCIIYQ